MLPRCEHAARSPHAHGRHSSVAARRDRLRRSLRIAPGPISNRVRADTAPAQLAARRHVAAGSFGLERRRPTSRPRSPIGSAGSTSPHPDGRLARAPHGVRRRRQARRLHRRRAARHGRIEPRARSAARHRRHGGRLAAVPHARLDRSGRDPRGRDARPRQTLYLLASKSGTTIEPNTLAAHFRRTLEDAGITRWADHFVAITDEGTELAQRARAESFRDIFINPSDIGGRYSALSFFGLVPAALMGQDIAAIIGLGTGDARRPRRPSRRDRTIRRSRSASCSAQPRGKAATS